MEFGIELQVDKRAVLRALGYGNALPDEGTAHRLDKAVYKLEWAAKPRYTYRQFPLEAGAGVSVGGMLLPGANIEAHLAGCHSCIVVALTLGQGADAAIRMAEAVDMAEAVLMDTAASVLIEQYADILSESLMQQAVANGEYVTGRFSPGYGDLSVVIQPQLVRLVDAQRAIGLSATESYILTPRKSITALVGVAKTPVQGQLAGCEDCMLQANCVRKNTSERCGANV